MMKKFLMAVAASLMLVSAAAFAAVPSVSQIEQSMTQGDWQKADSQLSEVLQAHPNNARAHYLYGQVLDREGRYADALSQMQQAKTLDPDVKFTEPSRFATTESRIRSDANRVSSLSNNNVSNNGGTTAVTRNPFNQGSMMAAAPERHGPSMGMWIGLVVLFVALALLLRWGLRRARSNDDGRADADRRTQLKRATELLNDVRTLKLDLRLSTQPGHEAMLQEAEGIETQLRQMVEALSNSSSPVPPYAVEDLSSQLDSLRARSEGRPDPRAASVPNEGQSAYAQEAERFGRGQQPQGPYSPYPPQQQPPVVVQQGGGFGGMGGGLGGLLSGVLLGEALSGGRDRVIEREVPVDEDELRRRGGNDNGNGGGGGLDFGSGSNDWNDNSGGIDVGSNDDSGGWDNNS